MYDVDETTIYYDALSAAFLGSGIAERCRPCSYTWNRNSKSKSIATGMYACSSIFSLMSANIGYNAQGALFNVAIIIVNTVTDGICLFVDFTAAVTKFNLVTSYMSSLCEYVSLYINADVAKEILTTWTDISANMMELYYAMGNATNMTHTIFQDDSYPIWGQVVPSSIKALYQVMKRTLATMVGLFRTLDTIFSKLVPSLLTAKENQDRVELSISWSVNNVSLVLFINYDSAVSGLFMAYNDYASDVCSFYYNAFTSFLLIIFNNDDVVVTQWKVTLEVQFTVQIQKISLAFENANNAIRDSNYFAGSELSSAFSAILTVTVETAMVVRLSILVFRDGKRFF